MAYDLPFLTSAQRKAANLRPRTEEELDPWGATTVPRAPRVWEPDIPTTGTPFVPETAPDFSMPQVGPEGIRAHPGIRGRTAPSVTGVPTPTPRPAERPSDIVEAGMTDEEWLEQVGPTFAAADPLAQQALLRSGIVDTPSEIISERQMVEQNLDEITKFERQYSNQTYRDGIKNYDRRLSYLESEGVQEASQYVRHPDDAPLAPWEELMEMGAGHVIYAAQKVIPGTQEFEAGVRATRADAPSYKEARAQGLPITGTLGGAIGQNVDDLPWYVIEPVKLLMEVLIDPLNAAAFGGRKALTLAMQRILETSVDADDAMERLTRQFGTPRVSNLLKPTTSWSKTEPMRRKAVEEYFSNKQDMYHGVRFQVSPYSDTGGGIVQPTGTPQPGFLDILKQPEVAYAAGDPQAARERYLTGLSKSLQEDIFASNRAFFGVDDVNNPIDYKVVGNGRIEIVSPHETQIRASNSAEYIFGIEPLQGGLSRWQQMLASAKKSRVATLFQKGYGARDWLIPEHELVTPVMRSWINGLKKVEGVASAFSRNVSEWSKVFNPDSTGRISSARVTTIISQTGDEVVWEGTLEHALTDKLNQFQQWPMSGNYPDPLASPEKIAPENQWFGGAPTLPDIAARLPYVWDNLTDAEKEAIEVLRRLHAPLAQVYTDLGHPDTFTSRTDIVTSIPEYIGFDDISAEARRHQGFYIPRGEAVKVPTGEEIPIAKVKLGESAFDPKPSHLKEAQFDSMAHAIDGILDDQTGLAAQYRYDDPKTASFNYVMEVGQHAWNMHLRNYYENLIDPNTGQVFYKSKVPSIPPKLKNKWTGVNNKIKSLLNSNRRIMNQLVPMDAEARRLAASESRQAHTASVRSGQRGAVTERARLKAALANMDILPTKEEARFLLSSLEKGSVHLGHLLAEIAQDRKQLSLLRRLTTKADNKLNAAVRRAEIALQEVTQYMSRGQIARLAADTTQNLRPSDAAGDRNWFDTFRASPEGMGYTAGVSEADAAALMQMGTPNASWEEWFGMLERVDELNRYINDLAGQSEGLHDEVNNLITKGQLARGEEVQARADLVLDRKRKRVVDSRERAMAITNHEYGMLRAEMGRLEKWALKDAESANKAVTRAEGRSATAKAKIASNKVAIQALEEARDEMSDDWARAVRGSRERGAPIDPDTGKGMSIIPLPGMGGHFWPDNMAQAARLFFLERGDDPGKIARALGNGIVTFNQVYRGVRGTGENSAFLIQMMLRHAEDPRDMAQAMKIAVHAWGVPAGKLTVKGVGGKKIEIDGLGETVLDSFIRNHDDLARDTATTFTTMELVRDGLILTGAKHEMTLGQGYLERFPGIAGLPIARHANRTFGALTDWGRITWADIEVQKYLDRGMNLDEISQSAEWKSSLDSINRMTGVAPNRFGGSVGELFLYAPRFLQARLTNFINIMAGAPSVATKWFGPTGWDVPGLRATAGQRMAAKNALRAIAWGAVMIEAVNTLQGKDTDWRPMIADDNAPLGYRYNRNFAKARLLGMDVSPFGTYESLLALIMTAGAEGPHNAARSMASGAMNLSWDLISGSTTIGERTRDSFQQAVLYTMGNFVPFFGEAIPDHVKNIKNSVQSGDTLDAIGKGAMAMLEFNGEKMSPMSLSEQKNELRLHRGQRLLETGAFEFQPDPTDPNNMDKARVISDEEKGELESLFDTDAFRFKPKEVPFWVLAMIDEDLAIQEIKDEQTRIGIERGTPYYVWRDTVDGHKQDRNDEFDKAMLEVGLVIPLDADGQIIYDQIQGSPGVEVKGQMRDAQSRFSTKMDMVEADEAFAEVYERIDKKEDSESAYNRAVEEINVQLYDTALVDALGRFDFDERDSRLAALEEKYGEAIITSALAQARADEHPLQKLYREDVEAAEYFWDAADSVANTIYNSPAVSQRDKDVLEMYLDPTTRQKQRQYTELAMKEEGRVYTMGDVVDKDVISLFHSLVTANRDWVRSAEGYGSVTPPSGAPSARRINEALIRWDWAKFAKTKDRPGQIEAFMQGVN